MLHQILAKISNPVTESTVVLDEVASHLDAGMEGCIPPQHAAPICNDLPWTYIALGITLGMMAVSISVSRIVRWLIDEGALEKVWALWGLVFMGVLGILIGAVVGWRIYDMVLGGKRPMPPPDTEF